MVLELTNQNFNNEINEGAIVVDFWAPWCGPCKMLTPIFEEISNEMKDSARFGKVNVDENQDIAASVGIMGIPCLIIFKDGKEADRITGFMNKEQLKAKLQEVL